MTQQSDLCRLIQRTKLIIWDEAPMMEKNGFDALDRTLRDLFRAVRENSKDMPFGGVTMVLGGDFRQILPVIPKGIRADIVANTVHNCNSWKHCKVFHLPKNMRINTNVDGTTNSEAIEFADWLLDIGNGTIQTMVNDRSDGSWISIPHDLLINPAAGVDGLVDVIYPNISLLHDDLSYFRTRAILAPRNDEVDFLNNLLLQRIQSEEQVYYSCDSALPLDESITHDPSLCTLEYLHSLNFNGVPPHILYLKVGAPVILLRNLDQSVGLCNGTRLLTSSA